VRQADRWASVFITGKLKNLCSQIPAISEDLPFAQNPDDFWLIDPQGSTKEFVFGLGDYTVNIARVLSAKVIFGIVWLPAEEISYCVGVGMPATLISKTSSAEIRVRPMPNHPIVTVSRSNLDDQTQVFCSKLSKPELISAGSSIKLCLVAEGKADLYPRFGRTMECGIAAGQVVLEAAGGAVVRADNLEPLDYGKARLENPSFIAVGDN
jgi:3'(2'), 5'-bisphosphate nucleotidase